ncbi:uncharacterized protein LOC133529668 isoform X2 [Cydia pomonella]|uniref:uncharacterized protein LOC133529668 isoform X2 n=1 Tax=Cydia pomonella TaxID=82600 RepID=UPI002ADDF85E|nr:uncharacterized protein LOC133529668 isoform X2 [Cydia pomonella]
MDRTMLYVCQAIVVLQALVTIGSADLMVERLDTVPLDDVADTDDSKDNIPHATPTQEEAASMPESMAHAMQEFMAAADLGQKMAQDGVHTQEETEKQKPSSPNARDEDERAPTVLQTTGKIGSTADKINVRTFQ